MLQRLPITQNEMKSAKSFIICMEQKKSLNKCITI